MGRTPLCESLPHPLRVRRVTYPVQEFPPNDGLGPLRCHETTRLSHMADGPVVSCNYRINHSAAHLGEIPIWGRRIVDLKPEYGGAGAGSVHMRAWVIWETPDAI